VIALGSSDYLVLGLVVLAMAGAILAIARWRSRARAAFAGPQAQRWPAATFWPRYVLLLAAAALIVFAAARPQWGSNEFVRERQGIDLVIALDISQSMTATDVSPDRLAVAQQNLTTLVDAERGSRIGLVFFAGSAILRSPLTKDTQAMDQLILRADREAGLTRVGSDLGAALDQAGLILSASQESGRAVLLVSDGEDFAGTFADKAAALKQKGIVVFTAGVGTAEGSTLQEIDPESGKTGTKTDASGTPIVTHLDEDSLRAIADAGGGSYVRLREDRNSLLVLRNDLANLDQTPIGADRYTVPIERFQPFVAAALVLLLLSWFLPSRLPHISLARLRRVRPHPGLAVVLVAVLAGACGGGDSLRQKNEAANKLFAAGDYKGALAAYQNLLAQRPDVDQLSYNAGNALDRLGNYDRAVTETERALPPADPKLGDATYYALGNHLLALGRLEEAYTAYRNALMLDPNDADAKYNLELTLALLNQPNQPPNDNSGQGPPDQNQGSPSPEGSATPEPHAQATGEATQAPAPNETPQAGGGTPEPDATPTGGSGSDPQLDLQEALKGLGTDITYEEAVHILQLLQQQQERGIEPPAGASGPDY
jgi:Ca-activated chloride channel family protein